MKRDLMLISILRFVRNKIRNLIFPEMEQLKDDTKQIKEFIAAMRLEQPFPPPHLIKQLIVKQYAHDFNIKVFIETGTYLGDMVFSVRKTFNRIYSIELGKDLYLNAKNRFRRYKNITILIGDSGRLLPAILKEIDEPCLFWLDAHYSHGITFRWDVRTPILIELDHIFTHHIKGHVILIDDAREFNGKEDYPTVKELEEIVSKYNPDYCFINMYDIIRIYKKSLRPGAIPV
jgi:hypothetical protein